MKKVERNQRQDTVAVPLFLSSSGYNIAFAFAVLVPIGFALALLR